MFSLKQYWVTHTKRNFHTTSYAKKLKLDEVIEKAELIGVYIGGRSLYICSRAININKIYNTKNPIEVRMNTTIQIEVIFKSK